MGPRLIGIVERATQSFDYRAAAQPLLEKLRDITQETAPLHIRQGNRRICIAAAYTTQPFGRIMPIGLPFPLAGSAAGHALLSQLDPTALELVLEDICDGPESEAVRTSDSTVRDRGYAESVNQPVAGVRGIAIPVGDDPGLGCLSVSGPFLRFDEAAAEALPHVRDIASALLSMRSPALRASR